MNYYSFHIGDYRRDTTHLSMLEHGAYRQLLDWVYLDEKPIPTETEVVFRRLSAKTEEDKNAILIVLKELFELTDDGYIQRRCMHEVTLYKGKAERARKAGKLGGRPKKTDGVISGLSNKTVEKANHKPITSNHKPLTNINPLTPLPPLSGKPTKQHKRTQLPDDYHPDKDHFALAAELSVDLVAELQQFKDHHAAKGATMANWDAALRTWIRNSSKFKARSGSSGRTRTMDDIRRDSQARLKALGEKEIINVE